MKLDVALPYGFLLLSIFSLFLRPRVFKKTPLWLPFLVLCYTTAVIVERASFFSLLYISLFGICIYTYYLKRAKLLFFIILILSVPLFYHFQIIGFKNFKYLDNCHITDDAIAYNLYFNLDKTLIGVFLIAFSAYDRKIEFKSDLRRLLVYLFMMMVLFSTSWMANYVRFSPKLPVFTPVWIIVNLCSTCLVEEALFRKFIQKEIYYSLNKKYAFILSITIASILFGIAHFKAGMMYIVFSLLAGFFYGYIYHKSKSIMSSIFLHFTFNLIHLLFFTYPALKQGI